MTAFAFPDRRGERLPTEQISTLSVGTRQHDGQLDAARLESGLDLYLDHVRRQHEGIDNPIDVVTQRVLIVPWDGSCDRKVTPDADERGGHNQKRTTEASPSGSRLAPPTSAPSMSGLAIMPAMLPELTDPP